MINKPMRKVKGLPVCHEQIKYLLSINDGVMERGIIRKELLGMGYTHYGIYEAFRRLEWRHEIEFEGSGHSPKQKNHLIY